MKSLVVMVFAVGLAAQTTDVSPRKQTGITFATLGTPADGTSVYCTDCAQVNPCVGSGGGAAAVRVGGAWQCAQNGSSVGAPTPVAGNPNTLGTTCTASSLNPSVVVVDTTTGDEFSCNATNPKWYLKLTTLGTGPGYQLMTTGDPATGIASARPACTGAALGTFYWATDTLALTSCPTETAVWTGKLNATQGVEIFSTTAKTKKTYAPDGTITTMGAAGSGDAGDLTTGTLVDARLSANVPLLNGNQTFTGAQTITGNFVASAAGHTQPVKKGTAAALPATCTQGELYFATNATAGQNLYMCTATDTWTQQLNSGGGGGISSGTSLAGTCAVGDDPFNLTAQYVSTTYNYYPGLYMCTATDKWTKGADNTAAGSAAIWPPMGNMAGYVAGNATLTATDNPAFVQFTLRDTMTISNWRVRLGTGSAGNYLGVNIYDSSCNRIGPSTTTGAETNGTNYPNGSLSLTLSPGVYWMAYWVSSATPAFFYHGETTWIQTLVMSQTTTKRYGKGSNAASNVGATITWPSACGTITAITDRGPLAVQLSN